MDKWFTFYFGCKIVGIISKDISDTEILLNLFKLHSFKNWGVARIRHIKKIKTFAG